MPIKFIPKITIGGYPNGQFAGGYIYSLQINQGQAESVNEIKMDIVYDKSTNIQIPNKNLTNPYRLQIGDMVIPRMFLIEHSTNISPSENVLSCTFIDGSFILDKYYVGLTNRHYKVDENDTSFRLKVYCSDCQNKILQTEGDVVRSVVANSPNQVYGNLLLVGEEEFNEKICDIPDVKYSFSDLIEVMTRIPNFRFEGFKEINKNYKTAYIGTLREVLSNWCSDFGFSFYWDFMQDKLVAIDLRNPINISSIKNIIDQNFNNGTLPISNYSYSESLNGTYEQHNTDYILKPKRNKEREIKDFFKITYSPIRLNQFLPLSSFNPSMLEVILAKYSPEARIIYTLSNLGSDTWPYKLGIRKLNVNIPRSIFKACLKNLDEFMGEQDRRFVVAYIDENIQAATNERYAKIADKIGRYYLNDSFIDWNPQSCNGDAKFQYTVNYDPAPLTTLNPFSDVGGSVTLPPAPFTSWLIERNPIYYEENNALTLDDAGPIYTNIDGDIANQIEDMCQALKIQNLAPLLRGAVIISYKPISISVQNNANNPGEENYTPEELEKDKQECETSCEKDIISEICKTKYKCSTVSRPAYGLVSKLSTRYRITNPRNGTYISVVAPAEQKYVGYAVSEGTFTWSEPAVKEINRQSYTADSNVMQYSVNLNDVTTEEPVIGQIDWGKGQNSRGLDIKQANPQQKISLKLIGLDFGSIGPVLNPKSGLSSFNVYINDNGIFADLTFENRPPEKTKPEVVMQKVGPQKIRIIK